jgi:hypothetical protein
MDIHSSSNANVCTTYTNYDFSKVILMHPESLHGGSGTFFTKIGIGNKNEILYLQTPKCVTKQGVITTAGKKAYIDLMFSNEDTSFIEFMENLEKSCIEKIDEKKNSWFTNEIDKSDIENAFTSALRPFKGGKYYSMRANIAPSKNLMKMPTCFVFDENEKQLTIDDIKTENDIISVLEIQGIKFTQRSFQFEIVLRQVLIMANKPVFQSCLIKKPAFSVSSSEIVTNENQNIHGQVEEEKGEKKYIEDSLADLHKIEKDTNTNVNIVEPKPLSNTLSSIALSMTNKEKPQPQPQPQDNELLELEKVEKREKGEKGEKNENNKKNEKSNELQEITEVDLEIKDDEKIKIKKPNDIYYEIYKAAKEKARTARKLAFDAYLEVKKIKNTYMLDDSDSDTDYNSDSDSDTNTDSDSGSGSEKDSYTDSDTENE